jgi:hypothetical protein
VPRYLWALTPLTAWTLSGILAHPEMRTNKKTNHVFIDEKIPQRIVKYFLLLYYGLKFIFKRKDHFLNIKEKQIVTGFKP